MTSSALFRRPFLALAAGLALTACETPAGKVSVLASDTVTLTPGATYAWAPVPATTVGQDLRVNNDIIQGRIRAAVDASLAAKGYRHVPDAGAANLLVAYYVGVQQRTEYRVDTYGGRAGVACGRRGCIGGWGLYGPPSADIRNVDYTQGALMLDITDRASGKLAWRAVSQKRVDEKDATQEGLNAIVADMTKTLPGGPSS